MRRAFVRPRRGRKTTRSRWAALAAAAAAAATACDGGRPPAEYSRVEGPPSGAMTVPHVQTSGFQAGERVAFTPVRNPFEGSAQEGRRFYQAFNCDGCHGGAGGGGIGPPFVTNRFIYGSEPGNIFQSIVQGRPQGMPAYGGKAPDEVIWKIVAYVSSLAEPYQAQGSVSGDGDDREHDGGG